MIALIGFTVAIPDLKAVEAPGLPLLTIGSYWLGAGLTKVFIAFVVFWMFAITVVGAAAQARLVYSLARDNMLPWSTAFRKVNSRTQTPVVALVEHVPGSFSLGRWAKPVIGLVLTWTVLVMLTLSLPSVLHGADKVVLGGAILAALWYFLALRGRLRNGTAGPAPIENAISDGAAVQPR